MIQFHRKGNVVTFFASNICVTWDAREICSKNPNRRFSRFLFLTFVWDNGRNLWNVSKTAIITNDQLLNSLKMPYIQMVGKAWHSTRVDPSITHHQVNVDWPRIISLNTRVEYSETLNEFQLKFIHHISGTSIYIHLNKW